MNDGMVLVVNSKPGRTPGLLTYSDGDAELHSLIAEVWGDLDGTSVTERTFGKGRAFWGQSLRAALDKISVVPDFEFTARAADAPVNCIHRKAGDADIYFVASRRREVEALVCTFRVSRQPEFWDAVTGEISKVAVFENLDDRVRVPQRLDRAGSMFVIFRSSAPARHVQEIAKDGAMLVTTCPFPTGSRGLCHDVTNNFAISVWVKPDCEAVPPVRASLTEPLGTGPVDACPPTYVAYPLAAETLSGANHATCGFGAARDGVVMFEYSAGAPLAAVTAKVPLAGWTHVAVVYRDGAPTLYVDGKPVGDSAKSGKTIHPGLGESSGTPHYFLGQATEPQLVSEALTQTRIQQLVAAGLPAPEEPPALEFTGKSRPELHFWQDGNYSLKDDAGRSSTIRISEIDKPIDIAGPWKVGFQQGRGAPPEITLAELKSLHRHDRRLEIGGLLAAELQAPDMADEKPQTSAAQHLRRRLGGHRGRGRRFQNPLYPSHLQHRRRADGFTRLSGGEIRRRSLAQDFLRQEIAEDLDHYLAKCLRWEDDRGRQVSEHFNDRARV